MEGSYLTMYSGPYFLAFIIAIVAKYQSGRCVHVFNEERGPLLAVDDESASPETATQGAALQEPAITSI